MSQYYIAYDTKSARELVTPEGIDLNVKLASLGSRFGAFCIDLGIMIVSIIVFTIGLARISGGNNPEMAGVIWILMFFFIRSFYFMFFEMGRKAATPGKRIMKIRVAARNKPRLTANAVFARNALREIEFFLPLSFVFSNMGSIDGLIALAGLCWSGIFLFFPMFNKDKLRAGDLIAGTWVVQAPRTTLLEDLSSTKEQTGKYVFSPTQVDAYGVHELHVLEDVIRRNDYETVRDVTDRIKTKIEWADMSPPQPGENPYANHNQDVEFLKAYYAALRGRLENRLLFGVRRKDKFDKR